MKSISVAAVLTAVASASALATPGPERSVDAMSNDVVTAAPFATIIDAPTGLSRDDPDRLNAALSSLRANLTSTDTTSSGDGATSRKLEFALPNTCNNVQPWLANTISSIDIFEEVDERCFIYTEYSCSDHLMGPLFEPQPQLDALFDNRVRSFFCV